MEHPAADSKRRCEQKLQEIEKDLRYCWQRYQDDLEAPSRKGSFDSRLASLDEFMQGVDHARRGILGVMRRTIDEAEVLERREQRDVRFIVACDSEYLTWEKREGSALRCGRCSNIQGARRFASYEEAAEAVKRTGFGIVLAVKFDADNNLDGEASVK